MAQQSQLTAQEMQLAGQFLVKAMQDARETVRQEIAAENRGHAVSAEDAVMFDSGHTSDDEIRARAAKLAASNVIRALDL